MAEKTDNSYGSTQTGESGTTDGRSKYVFDWNNPGRKTESDRDPILEVDGPEKREETKNTAKNPDERTEAGSRTARSHTGSRTARSYTGSRTAGSRAGNSSSGGKRRKKKRGARLVRAWVMRIVTLLVLLAVLALIIFGVTRLVGAVRGGHRTAGGEEYDTLPEYVTEQYLTVNSYSRPGIAIGDIKGVVVHYTANPGTTAEENWEYFEGLATSGETHASSHFIIGTEGEVLAAVPLNELAYASNSRNTDTISIECCHLDETGVFTQETYDSLVKLTAWLCGKYGLSANSDVIRHYDVSGKLCPKYYVDNPDEWKSFKKEVAAVMKEKD